MNVININGKIRKKIPSDLHMPPLHPLYCDRLTYTQNASIGSMKIAIPTPIKL